MDKTDETSRLAAFTQIGHAFFARDGVKLAFGKRWDNKLIHISQANRGAACGCECPAPSCRRKLIAHKPKSNVKPHFAHAPLTPSERAAGVPPACEHGAMTARHAYAEELLNREKRLVLPPVSATLGSRTRTIRSAKEFTFDSAMLEAMDGGTIPDVILSKGEHRMHVEIFVTHRCGPEKRTKIAAANISAVEIDLSSLAEDITVAELNDAILRSAPRFWIHNRKAQEALIELQAEANAEAEHARKLRKQAATRLTKDYADAEKRALASPWKESAEVAKVIDAGDAKLLKGARGGEGYFTVHPHVWKAAILNLLDRSFRDTNPDSLIVDFSKRGWLAENFRRLKLHDESLLEEATLPHSGAEQVIVNFLDHLAKKHVAEVRDRGWTYTPQHAGQLDRRKREKEQLIREANERAARHKRLIDLVGQIILLAKADEPTTFDIDAWMMRPVIVSGQTAKLIADDGGPSWRELVGGLSNTLAVLKDEQEGNAADFGLPIRHSIQAVCQLHKERTEQRRLQAERTAEEERQERIDLLMKSARLSLGNAYSNWLNHPNAALDGQTPRTAAAESSERLTRTMAALDKLVVEIELKSKWLKELEREAARILRKPEWITLYLNSSDPKLPGCVSPEAYVKDETTMRKCLALLKQRAVKR